MTSWPKPFCSTLEINDEAKDKFKLFTGQVDVAQPSLLNPGKYGRKIGTASVDLRLATVIFKLANLE